MTDIDNQPQFGTAEYSAGPDACTYCKQQVGSQYYRVGSSMACTMCAERLRSELPKEGGSAYMRGLLFGCVAAFLGFVLYATVGIVTGFEIGYVSLAVGIMVGKGIKMGSRGFGGRKYQFTALLLTYAAVSMSAVPISLYMYSKEQKQAANEPKVTIQGETSPGQAANDPNAKSQSANDEKVSASGVGLALLTLAFIGLASPFLGLAQGFSGVIGLFILLIGLNIAWKTAAGEDLTIEGPFENTPSMSAKATGV